MPGHDGAASAPARAGAAAGRLRALRNGAAGVLGAIAGLAPHALHRIALLAGTALIASAGGIIFFGILGLAAFVPLPLRLRRRFAS